MFVEYPSDISRLKKEAAAFAAERYGEEGAANADFFVIANATLLTMETGHVQPDLIHDAVLVTRGGEIEAIVGVHDFVAPYGATVLDAEGGTYRLRYAGCATSSHVSVGFIVPGFIDVHAHWSGYGTNFPVKSWEMETFLAYGVTTLHK